MTSHCDISFKTFAIFSNGENKNEDTFGEITCFFPFLIDFHTDREKYKNKVSNESDILVLPFVAIKTNPLSK